MSNDHRRQESTSTKSRSLTTFFVATVLITLSAANLSHLIPRTGAAINPLAVGGFVLDTQDTPVEGAAVTITMFDAGGSVRATRTATSEVNGAYQTSYDFEATEWDIGNRVEVVAVYGADYGSNYTVLDSLNTQELWTWVNITYPYKLAEPVTFTLALVPGWNFITIPLVGGPYKASNIGLHALDVVSQYNPTTRVYDRTYIVGASPISMDITFMPSTGYWISTTVWQNISITGIAPAGTQTRNVTMSSTGWVNLGLMTLNTTMKASAIPPMFSGGSVTTVAWYNPVTKTYKTYIAGVPPSDYTLIPGQAYWCSCTAGGNFTYTP